MIAFYLSCHALAEPQVRSECVPFNIQQLNFYTYTEAICRTRYSSWSYSLHRHSRNLMLLTHLERTWGSQSVTRESSNSWTQDKDNCDVMRMCGVWITSDSSVEQQMRSVCECTARYTVFLCLTFLLENKLCIKHSYSLHYARVSPQTLLTPPPVDQTNNQPVYGLPLEQHLDIIGQPVSTVIHDCCRNGWTPRESSE